MVLSVRLVISNASGVGRWFDEEVVRAAIVIRVASLARGYSGGRPEVLQVIVEMLNRGVTPAVPEYGSLGASGDLIPLAHLALVVSRDAGEDQASDSGQALTSEVTAAMTIEAVTGFADAFLPQIHRARGQPRRHLRRIPRLRLRLHRHRDHRDRHHRRATDLPARRRHPQPRPARHARRLHSRRAGLRIHAAAVPGGRVGVAAFRLKAALTVDSGIGVVRHGQAGYERAREVAESVGPREGLSVPLWWTREATFGPGDA